MTIIGRIREHIDGKEIPSIKELASLSKFSDLTYHQIANALQRIKDPQRDRKYYQRHPSYLLHRNARRRSIERNIYFDLERSDIVIPTTCPILGIPMFPSVGKRGGGPSSPTVDRIDPSKGYTKDNIHVISKRANGLKSDASMEEMKKICAWVNRYMNES